MWYRKTVARQIERLWYLSYFNYARAVRIAQKIANLKEIEHNPGLKLNILVIQGRLAILKNDYEEARTFTDQAEHYAQMDDPSIRLDRYHLLKSVMLIFDGEILEAKRLMESTLEQSIALEDKIVLISLYYNLGEIEKETYHDYEKAHHYFNQSAQIAVSCKHPLLPRILMNQGVCSALSGDEQKALALCEKAVHAMNRTRNMIKKAVFYFLGAQLQWQLGKLSNAKVYLNSAEKWVILERDPYTSIDIFLLKGKIAYAELCYDEALLFADQANEIMEIHKLFTQSDDLQLLYKMANGALGEYGKAGIHRELYRESLAKNKTQVERKRF